MAHNRIATDGTGGNGSTRGCVVWFSERASREHFDATRLCLSTGARAFTPNVCRLPERRRSNWREELVLCDVDSEERVSVVSTALDDSHRRETCCQVARCTTE